MEAVDAKVAGRQAFIDNIVGRFAWPDYIVFILMLLLSASIGVFFGFFSKKKQDTKEFLMAGKSMTTFPVAMSLVASFMSAITLLGTPSEVYQHGTVYWLIGFSYFLVMPSAAYLYLPVFQRLDVTSAYEYLEIRFHRSVRMLGSAIFIVQMLLYMAIVVYAPALALSQVTGINTYLSCTLICFVCIFYTVLGGMKAVLWTDTLQVIIMYGSIMFVILKGMVDQGGFNEVWRKNVEGGRVELINWDPNPTTRHTFWTLVIGGYFTWITIYGCNQAQVQRYMSVQKGYMAVQALWINLFALFLLMLTCSFGGMVIYAKYQGCDPIKNGYIEKGDQLFPLFVMDTLGHLPGLPGFFVAGIFSGALSTVSSGMNSLAATVLEDFIKVGCFPSISEENATRVSKGLSLFFGVLTFALVFVAEQLGDVLSAALSIFGMVGGPLLGTFTLGMFFPWANAKGAFVGTVSGLCFVFWIGVGFQVKKLQGFVQGSSLPTDIESCPVLNTTALLSSDSLTATPIQTPISAALEETPEILSIYKLSYMWYSATGMATVIIVGMIVSLITGKQNVRKLNPDTLSPGCLLFKRWLPGMEGLGEECTADIKLQSMKSEKSSHDQSYENAAYKTK